jgi:hypothetical protein
MIPPCFSLEIKKYLLAPIIQLGLKSVLSIASKEHWRIVN